MENQNEDLQEQNIIRLEIADEVKENLIDDDEIIDLAELFKVFADSTRMKIICSLEQKELCVGEISYITGVSQSAVSHQLRVLKQAKLVKYRKEGKIVYYSLDDYHVAEIVKKGCEHIEEV